MHRSSKSSNFQMRSTANRLTVALFVVYAMALFWIIVLKLNIRFTYMSQKRSMNLVPFNEPLILNGRPDMGEQILNILIFIPLGIYTTILIKKWGILKSILSFSLVSFTLENIQYLLSIGAFDITDIITNTTGGTLGLLFQKILIKIFGNELKAQKLINALALFFTFTILGLLFYLKINKLFMFRM